MRLMVLKSGPLDLKGLCHRPGGTAGNSWWVYAARSNPDPISEKKNVIFHTRFQTWSLKSIPDFRPERGSQNATLHVYIKQKLCHHC